jgi:hypothetical protein
MPLLISGKYEEELEFPPVLKDGEWDQLGQLSGLPPEARASVDMHIALYRYLRATADTANHARVRAQLESARNKLGDAIDALEELEANADVFSCLAMGREGQPMIHPVLRDSCFRRIGQIIAEMQDGADWCKRVLGRVPDGRDRGHESLLALIQGLNEVYKWFKKKPITRTKDKGPFKFVIEACQIANRDLAVCTIDRAAKEIISFEPGNRNEGEVRSIFDDPDLSPLLAK